MVDSFGDFLMENVFPAVFTTLFIGVLCAVLMVGCDFIQERRSFDAQVACEQKRQIAKRQSFSTRVICVQPIQRRDTLSLEVK